MAEQQTAGPEGLTAQEAAYFESGGESTEGLGASTPAAPEAGAQTQQADPQQQTQQDPAAQQQQQEQRMVPLAALQEERAERKQLRDRMQQMEQQQTALIQRILASQQPAQQQEQQIQIPDYATDPVGHLRAKNDLLERQLRQVTEHVVGQTQQQQQFTQQHTAQMQIQHHLAADEAAFRQKAPDYDNAAAFLQQSRAAEYRALGMTNPMEIQQALQQDVMAMISIAQRNGTSVAEAAYNLAKTRGYKSAQASGAGGQGQSQQQDNAARLATIQQGQQQSASLSGAGGGGVPPMSIEKLLSMSDADFAKATSGMNWEKLNAELSAR